MEYDIYNLIDENKNSDNYLLFLTFWAIMYPISFATLGSTRCVACFTAAWLVLVGAYRVQLARAAKIRED